MTHTPMGGLHCGIAPSPERHRPDALQAGPLEGKTREMTVLRNTTVVRG